MHTLSYAGKNLADFGVYFDSSQIFNKPEKLFNSFAVPNRNGNLMSSLKKYNNIQIVYSCYIKENFADNYNNLIDYLTSFDTYQKLENSVEPLSYRMGIYHAETLVDTGQFLKDGQFSLSFDCKPQNFFNSGDELYYVIPSLTGNQWNGADISWRVQDRLSISYANFKYTIQGEIRETLTTYHNQSGTIPLPYAGSWQITLRVVKADPVIGASFWVNSPVMGLRNQRLYLNELQSRTIYVESGVTPGVTDSFGFYVGALENTPTGTISAEVEVSLYPSASSTDLLNPSLKSAKPVFIYNNVGTATSVYLNGSKAFEYTPPIGALDSDGALYIDSDTMDCYLLKNDGTIANYNPYVTFTNDFPILLSGTNTIYTTNGDVYVKPRWWKL